MMVKLDDAAVACAAVVGARRPPKAAAHAVARTFLARGRVKGPYVDHALGVAFGPQGLEHLGRDGVTCLLGALHVAWVGEEHAP